MLIFIKENQIIFLDKITKFLRKKSRSERLSRFSDKKERDREKRNVKKPMHYKSGPIISIEKGKALIHVSTLILIYPNFILCREKTGCKSAL